ncbi:hypothetical protein DXG01_000473, partial [Tephrocybe rancida]
EEDEHATMTPGSSPKPSTQPSTYSGSTKPRAQSSARNAKRLRGGAGSKEDCAAAEADDEEDEGDERPSPVGRLRQEVSDLRDELDVI